MDREYTYRTTYDPIKHQYKHEVYKEGLLVRESVEDAERLEDHTLGGSGMAKSFNIDPHTLQPQIFDADLAVSKDVRFTRQQLAYLETVFPEVLEIGLTEADIRTRLGQRIVIAHIRNRVSG